MIALRIRLSNPERLAELRDFFRAAHAMADTEGDQLIVSFPGAPRAGDERQLRAYLDTWLGLAEVRREAETAEIIDG